MDQKTSPPDYHPQTQGGWDPKAQPASQQPLGAYNPHAHGQPQMQHQQPMMAPAPGMVLPPGAVMIGQYPTATFCPATGGAHVPVSRAGAMGIIIGILFCPCGLIAIPFDKKITCTMCNYVIQESWGGC